MSALPYGANNILGRWLNYASSGHGGNALLRARRNPENFRLLILYLTKHSLRTCPADEVISLEFSWKTRLHTRHR